MKRTLQCSIEHLIDDKDLFIAANEISNFKFARFHYKISVEVRMKGCLLHINPDKPL